jgi:hypothetical protein
VSTVPRHSEEELRQQWAFLDALVDRQAASLKSGNQDPEDEELPVTAAVPVDGQYLEEIATLTRRVASLESERTTLIRRIDLAEQARMPAETGRAAAETAREAAERALADAKPREVPAAAPAPVVASAPDVVAPVAHAPVTAPQSTPPLVTRPTAPARKAPMSKSRRRSWWQRFRE